MVKCIAPGCKSGYKNTSESENEKIHFFSVPKNENLIKLWQKAIMRKNFTVKAGQSVCAKHFHKEDILFERVLKGPDGAVLGKSPYKCARLRKGALPLLFPACPSYLSKPAPKLRKSPAKRKLENNLKQRTTISKKVKIQHKPESSNYSFETEEITCSFSNNPAPHNPEFVFASIFCFEAEISAPTSWSRQNICSESIRAIQFTQWKIKKKDNDIESICTKQVLVDEKMSYRIIVMGRKMKAEDFGFESDTALTAQDLENIIKKIDNYRICSGCAEINSDENIITSFTHRDKEGYLRHNLCPLLLIKENEDESKTKITDKCKFCMRAKHTLNQKLVRIQKRKEYTIKYLKLHNLSPNRRKKIQSLQNQLKAETRAKLRARQRICILKATIRSCQEKIANTNTDSLNQMLDGQENLSRNERTAIVEMFAAARQKNSKNRRYSDDWVILCLLLHMRSPVAYRMLRDNKILPLPCTRTIGRYLALIDTPCGFDSRFFGVLKKYLNSKPEIQRDGLILMDEMKTRKSLLLDYTTMSYKGVTNFGNKESTEDVTQNMADYGLIIAFQPVNDDYTQPIAVFASKGPVHGDVLAKLIIEAICLLERAGAKVHGVIADGAATNRRVWTEMGCSGKMSSLKNSFEHPIDENRKVFFFSDSPHLIKNVRNRLANNLKLQVHPDESPIQWKYFKTLHDIDKLQPAGNRRCPRITDAHIDIAKNSLTKMRVCFAVQILSKSVASGLRFYRRYEKQLENCESTAKFCEKFNDLFDTLNRTSAQTGLRLGCNDFKVLEDTLKWLDEWEKRVNDNLIPTKYFLTSTTAEGLRMTIHSTIDLATYLLKEKKYDVVLTGKINQDPLERFFGTVRLAGGTNDHPATPTFLQIYKILAFYSILKPPKTGNCKIDDDRPIEPLISISELKQIYKTKKTESIVEKIKEKLNIVIKNEDGDFSDFIHAIDHDYGHPHVVDCLMYYVTGQICEKLKKRSCTDCRSALFYSENDTMANHPVCLLNTWDENNNFSHPNFKLFQFIKTIETYFIAYSKHSDVFDLVVNELTKKKFYFTCAQHGKDVLAYVIHSYLQYRMRQFAKICLADSKKANLQKKKEAKLAVF